MRLIDADTLYKSFGASGNCNNCPLDAYKCQYYNEHTLMEFCERIDDAPTVDAVEVVRCKDCKWYKESNHSELYPMRFCYRLKNDDGVPVGYNWADNDFCSYGERRDKKTASYYGDNKLIETVVIDERETDETD